MKKKPAKPAAGHSETSLWTEFFDGRAGQCGDVEAANSYFSAGNFRFFRKNVLQLAGDIRGRIILDAGCGTGHFTAALAGGNLLAGADFSRGMLLFARKKGLVPVQTSVHGLPFREGSFDLVLSNSVIQCVENGRALIAELVRVARPGGRIIVSTANGENMVFGTLRRIKGGIDRYLHVRSQAEIRDGLVACGARVLSVLSMFYPLGLAAKRDGRRPPGVLARRFSTAFAVEAVKAG
jgi:SAM-dependent methyltransferase